MEIKTNSDRKFDVVVIGGIGIDTNVYLQGKDIDFEVEANFTENIDYIGQAGGYTSRGFAQLGYKTAFIGTVGDDYSGEFIRKELSDDSIDTTALSIDPSGTKRSVNFMYQDGRRKNFYDGKDHMNFAPDIELCTKVLSNAKHVHFNLMNWSRKLLPIAKDLNLTISCDLQDVIHIEDQYRKDFIQFSDMLFFSSTNFPDPTPIIKSYLKKKKELIIIVGRGKKGVVLGTAQEISYYPSINIDNRPIVDTNGAGDGLAVGVISSYFLDKYSIDESILRGQIIAKYTCSIKASTKRLIFKNLLDDLYTKIKSNSNLSNQQK